MIIGLRLTDVEEMDLQSEPVSISGNWSTRTETLERHGATPEEIAFLRNRRVELYAMTSREMVEFIDGKLAEHRVNKAIPDGDTIERHARRLLEQRFANEAVKRMAPEIAAQASGTTLPTELRQVVEARLRRWPELPWDAALYEAVHDLDI